MKYTTQIHTAALIYEVARACALKALLTLALARALTLIIKIKRATHETAMRFKSGFIAEDSRSYYAGTSNDDLR